MCLAYIDARTAAEELDKKFGDLNWRFTWRTGSSAMWAVKGQLSVYNSELKEWITRQDVGYPQEGKTNEKADETEWMKDAVSDALKRCAVQFGVGRFLYDAPTLFTYEVKVDQSGKVYKLTDLGEKEIQGRINTWYKKVTA